MTRFWNKLHQVRSISNIGKPNNLKAFGSNRPKALNRIAKISFTHGLPSV